VRRLTRAQPANTRTYGCTLVPSVLGVTYTTPGWSNVGECLTGLTTLRPPVSFVDRESATSEVHPVETGNRRSGRTALRHVYEAKAPAVACLVLSHHKNGVHSPIQLKKWTEVVLVSGKRQITYKNLHLQVLMGGSLATITKVFVQDTGTIQGRKRGREHALGITGYICSPEYIDELYQKREFRAMFLLERGKDQSPC
jgi:hypothetical protein